MTIEETPLSGCFVIQPRIFKDSRGYFFETFKRSCFQDLNMNYDFIQDNESMSHKGVLRGLHYQIGTKAQAKLVRVIQGSVLDVVVDVRPGSDTFGRYFKIMLSGANKTQLLVPRGFAHGFLVLENNTIFSYKCDNAYHKESERGIIFNDKDINIDWGVSENELLLSDKDRQLPQLKDAEL